MHTQAHTTLPAAPTMHRIPTLPAVLREFIGIARRYRRAHGAAYAARIAHGCAVQGLPF